jgi:hypothetical protein
MRCRVLMNGSAAIRQRRERHRDHREADGALRGRVWQFRGLRHQGDNLLGQTARDSSRGARSRVVKESLSQRYWIVFEATLDRAPSMPPVVYALTAKYHVPGARSLTT